MPPHPEEMRSSWNAFRETLIEARQLDETFGQLRDVEFRLTTESAAVATAARFAIDFERELRRAVRLLEDLDRPSQRPGLPLPMPPAAGGLQVEDAASGSLELILVPYGALVEVANYAPVQVAALTTWLIGCGARIYGWAGGRGHSNNQPSATADFGVIEFQSGVRVRVPAGTQIAIKGSGPNVEVEITIAPGPPSADRHP